MNTQSNKPEKAGKFTRMVYSSSLILVLVPGASYIDYAFKNFSHTSGVGTLILILSIVIKVAVAIVLIHRAYVVVRGTKPLVLIYNSRFNTVLRKIGLAMLALGVVFSVATMVAVVGSGIGALVLSAQYGKSLLLYGLLFFEFSRLVSLETYVQSNAT